jgi:hypothetical protein
MRTVKSVAATRSMRSRTARIAALDPVERFNKKGLPPGSFLNR